MNILAAVSRNRASTRPACAAGRSAALRRKDSCRRWLGGHHRTKRPGASPPSGPAARRRLIPETARRVWLAVALLWSCEAGAYIETARLTFLGEQYYSQDFSIGGHLNVESDYLTYSRGHILNRSSAQANAGFDMTYAGLRLGQTLTYLDDDFEYLLQLEYNRRWSRWDIQLRMLGRIHLRDRLENFIEYGLSSGIRIGDRSRMALHLMRIEDNQPHYAAELLHEWNWQGVFHWQNLLGFEQGYRSITQTVDGVAPGALPGDSQRWFPYLKSKALMEFSIDETWSPAFEIGIYLTQNRITDNIQFSFLWGLRLAF